MRFSAQHFLATIPALILIVSGCGKRTTPLNQSPVSGQLKHFIAEKKAQATAAAGAEGQEMLPEFKTIFAAAERGDWETISNTFNNLHELAVQFPERNAITAPDRGWFGNHIEHWRYRMAEKRGGQAKVWRLHGTQWEDVREIRGAFDCLASDPAMDKYSVAFGQDIVRSIPAGSIYFGGSDPGRWTVTALQTSHVNGDPFFTLTQNALADPTYLQYLEGMYGRKIYIPTTNDSQKCFQDYMQDVQRRIMDDQASSGGKKQVKPGEDVKVDTSGHVQVSGQVAVMAINAELVKVIFDHETNREFYVEESFPLDWMYPYLEPHGLIIKINHDPLAELPDDVIRKDHEFWTQRLIPIVGDWLKEDTSVQEICAFAEKVYVKHDFTGFKGDPRVVTGDWPEWMAKMRNSIAGIYMWRMGSDPTGGIVPEEIIAKGAARERLVKEADFAFRQAFAVCPGSTEVVFRYAQFLANEKRASDALAVAEIALELHKGDANQGQFQALVDSLKNVHNQESQSLPATQTKP